MQILTSQKISEDPAALTAGNSELSERAQGPFHHLHYGKGKPPPEAFFEKLQKAQKKGSTDLSHLDFSRFDELLELQQGCKTSIRLAFCAQSLHIVGANLASNKQRLQLLSPDDLLSTLRRALQLDSVSAGGDVTGTAQGQTLAKRMSSMCLY